MTTTIIGVKLEIRIESAIEFQRIITEFGCEIRTRIGIHPSDENNSCTNCGIILLEINGDGKKLIEKLSKHSAVQIMTFQ